jgi:transcriptional regulator with XRE-family HTH domain
MAKDTRPLRIPDSEVTFGQAVRWARLQRGWTLRQLAAATFVSAVFWCDVEHDRRQTDRAEQLADVLGVELADLERRQGVTRGLTDWLSQNPKLVALLRDIRACRCKPSVLKALGLNGRAVRS